MTSQVSGSSHFVFCPPPPGKPNPNEPWDESAGDTRTRVPQPPQKGDTCFYYAIKMIHPGIGKRPTPSQEMARRNEAAVSRYRKRLTQITVSLKWQPGFAQTIKDNLGTCAKSALQNQLEDPQFPPVQEELRAESRRALEVFCRQTEESDYLTYATNAIKQAESDSKCQLYRDLGISQDNLDAMSHAMEERIVMGEGKPEKGPKLTRRVRNFLPYTVIAQAYQLQRSAWHPAALITSLMEELRQHGPHVVSGHFGQLHYQALPFRLSQEVEGRPVFGWKPDAPRKERSDCHAVTLVGARSDTGHIYFIDPLDGSDPADLQTQKIYVMSYAKFRLSLVDLFGNQGRTAAGEAVFVAGNPFAFHAGRSPSLISRLSDLTLECKTKAPEEGTGTT
jgi:hypothetical protein